VLPCLFLTSTSAVFVGVSAKIFFVPAPLVPANYATDKIIGLG